MITDDVSDNDRLDHIIFLLETLVAQRPVREWHSTQEVATILGKSEFTVREWCRNRRIQATKKKSGRGAHAAWSIPHAELLRYQQEGLLPEQ